MLNDDIPYGYCQCGCGKKTNISAATRKKRGLVKGEPYKFLLGHYKHYEGRTNDRGYVLVTEKNHPRSRYKIGRIHEHVLVAEKVLGKFLPPGAVVHHINGDGSDNRPENLVICESISYHLLLHARQNALAACGHADWRKCRFCHKYDDPSNMQKTTGGTRRRLGSHTHYHRKCDCDPIAYSLIYESKKQRTEKKQQRTSD